MLLAASAALAAAAVKDRRLLEVVAPITSDIAAAPVGPTAAAMAPNPATNLNTGVVEAARVSSTAASEWAAEDLAAPPAYTLVGCFQDGTDFKAPRRLARRLHVGRGERGWVPTGSRCGDLAVVEEGG
jgi:hypothetical protein